MIEQVVCERQPISQFLSRIFTPPYSESFQEKPDVLQSIFSSRRRLTLCTVRDADARMTTLKSAGILEVHTSFSFQIRFADSAESSDLSNLKIRDSYYLPNTTNNEHECAVVARASLLTHKRAHVGRFARGKTCLHPYRN